MCELRPLRGFGNSQADFERRRWLSSFLGPNFTPLFNTLRIPLEYLARGSRPCAACKLPPTKIRVLSGHTLRQEIRQGRPFRDQTGNPVSQDRGARSREPRQSATQNGIAEQS